MIESKVGEDWTVLQETTESTPSSIPESDKINGFRCYFRKTDFCPPYLDRYLGLTLEDATDLAAANGLLD